MPYTWEQFDLSDASEFQTALEQYAADDSPEQPPNGSTEPPMTTKTDLAPYFQGSTVYELGQSIGGTELLQTQAEAGGGFRHVKQGGAAQWSKWERLCATANYIWRDLDTSGDVEVYRLSDNNQPWSKWCPRYMAVGEVFTRNPKVTWYNKHTGVAIRSYTETSNIRLVSVLPSWKTFVGGVTIQNVICLEYFHAGGEWIERYYYGKGYGLVGWESRQWKSGVSVAQSPHPAPKPEQLGAWANPPPLPADTTPPQPQPPQVPPKPANAADPVTFTNMLGVYNLRYAADKNAADIGDLRNGETIKAYRVPESSDGTNLWHYLERLGTVPTNEAPAGYSAIPLPAPEPPEPEPPDDEALILVRDHLVSVSHTLQGLAADLMKDVELLDALIAQTKEK